MRSTTRDMGFRRGMSGVLKQSISNARYAQVICRLYEVRIIGESGAKRSSCVMGTKKQEGNATTASEDGFDTKSDKQRHEDGTWVRRGIGRTTSSSRESNGSSVTKCVEQNEERALQRSQGFGGGSRICSYLTELSSEKR
eukprot:6187104-Pleurochrysis_carterae.AAC.3